MRVILAISVTLLLLAGCASTPPERAETPSPAVEPQTGEAAGDLVAVLEEQHRRWRGTPYRYGGRSPAGIDCSGFVQVTFSERLARSLPRTTRQQARRGEPVAAAALRAGDLVFFRTGGGKLHVGIYVEGGHFLHASTSRGVTLSRLDNPYWSRHYWQARRILTPART
ncbi:C40 family peptidase [Spiribacter halobius]|uniref:NlpC/P60 domain-containing protein n=1 Tax=Sediminicurvatus halobius TaxID=2182432 RepID=A0A2U2N210_9GAMM|nr:NlpC/P60 family protein [Spiribacter halobius]PWG63112.1 hypothetical protein DEM34_09680 [Spiribacter halobius]UEX77561.1 NlpC/P60 family protein [Spiribacter halobius]